MRRKELVIAAIAVAIFTTGKINAQDFKPEAGAKNIEVNFTPFADTPIEINSLRLRFFKSPDIAMRLGIHLQIENIEDPEGIDLVGAQGQISNYETSEFNYGIDLGFEKHWKGTDRLSPYWGFEVGFRSESFTEKFTERFQQQFGFLTRDFEFTRSNFLIGANLLIGADYYFAPKFYFGTEIGFGIATTIASDIEINIDSTPNNLEGPSSLEFGENINSAIRVGFIF